MSKKYVLYLKNVAKFIESEPYATTFIYKKHLGGFPGI